MVTLKPKHLYFYCWLRRTATSHAEGRCVTGAFVTGSNYKNIALKEREGARECIFKKGFYFKIKPESLKTFFASPFAPAEHSFSLQRVPPTRVNLPINFRKLVKAEGDRAPKVTQPSLPPDRTHLFLLNHPPRSIAEPDLPLRSCPMGQGSRNCSPSGQVESMLFHRRFG